jgi:hypothetical protein
VPEVVGNGRTRRRGGCARESGSRGGWIGTGERPRGGWERRQG